MNKVILLGRLTRMPELRYTTSNVAVSNFSIAINRNYQTEDGERIADFINCVAYNKNAENISKYFQKGNLILVEGSIRIDKVDDKYYTKVLVDRFEFVESKNKITQATTEESQEPIENDPFSDFGDSVQIDDGFLD